jgi:hypothetical protein
MNLSNYISGLQLILDQHGDLPCYYSRDDEGNGYQEVLYDGSLYYVTKLEHCVDDVYLNKEEYDDCVGEGYADEGMTLIPICVVN